MSDIIVTAQSRSETGKNVNRRLRQRDLIPGVLYGKKKDSVLIAVSPKEVGAVLHSPAGTSTLFDLEYEGKRRKVILKEYQAEPTRGHLLHADFYEVALDKPIKVKVHVELTGTPVGVKVEGGFLDFVTRELDIECLPLDIPEKLVVDVTPLALGRHFRVSDLTMPEKVTVLTEPDIVVAHVVARREEEVAPAAAEVAAEGEAATAAEPEVIKKGKTAEGEAAGEAKPEKAEKPEKGEKKERK